jgi:hypothetical protein
MGTDDREQGRPARVPQFTSGGDRPRAVVEDADPTGRRATERELRREGWEVLGCCGPETLARRRCPVEEGRGCPAVRDADLVVTTLRDERGRLPGVLRGLRETHAEVPVIVRAPAHVAHARRRDLEGCEVHPVRTPVRDVLAARAAPKA